MKINKIIDKVKTVPSKLPRVKLPQKSSKPTIPSVKLPKQYSATAGKIFSSIAQFFKSLFAKLRQADLLRYVRIVLAALLVIYVIGGFVLAYFAYTTKPDKKTTSSKDIKISKRDIWVGKFAQIYPLPAASVNGQWISLSEFYRQVGYIKTFNIQVPDSLSKDITDEKSLRLSVLNNLISSSEVRQQAAKAKITVSQKDVDAAYKTAADANGGEQQIAKVLKKMYNMTPDEFKKLIQEQLYQEKIRDKVLVQVHIKHILVTDQAKADAALARLQKGESFDAVAKSVSEDANSKDKGGDLGWLGRDDLKDQVGADFETAVMALKKGQTSGVIKSKYGYHIVQVVDKKGSVDQSYTDWQKKTAKKAKVVKYVKS